MKRKTTKAAPATAKRAKPKTNAASGLRALFVEELKDIYWVEKALTKTIPKMIKNASSPELVKALTEHLDVTQDHVKRLEKIFSSIGEKAVAKKCQAMIGLIKEAEEIIGETEKGVVRDAAIILSGQKVEHYEIAAYGTLRSFATTLGETASADLLEETLAEEKDADETLTEIAESSINVQAKDEDESTANDTDTMVDTATTEKTINN